MESLALPTIDASSLTTHWKRIDERGSQEAGS